MKLRPNAVTQANISCMKVNLLAIWTAARIANGVYFVVKLSKERYRILDSFSGQ